VNDWNGDSNSHNKQRLGSTIGAVLFLFFCFSLFLVLVCFAGHMLTADLWSSSHPVSTDAIDKGDNRRLGKKPVFTSSQVIFQPCIDI